LYAATPHSTAINTLSRHCSSGLALADCTQVANQIRAAKIDIGIGPGLEDVTAGYDAGALPEKFSDAVISNRESDECMIPIGRLRCQVVRKAAAAQKAGKFKRKIVPGKAMWLDPKSAEEKDVVVDSEGDIRGGVTTESPCKLEPAIKNDGSNHAGNASPAFAGASAILLVRRRRCKENGPQILCKVVIGVAVGAPPEIVDAGRPLS
ncbi:3-ketoacyl-CoA thiolase with broad chain length specificity, partial [Tulasnella sp. 408]